MSSKDFGLGPKWWQKPENKLLKCAERKSDWCDPTETDGCCAIIPCTYCLELEIYGDEIQYGTAEFSESGWFGTVGGKNFIGYWEHGYESGECEFVVLFDGMEVYRKSCYEGQSCRDSSDEAEVTVNYEAGTLRWIRNEPLPLPYVNDPESGCKTWYCGDCECTCRELCVVIRPVGGAICSGTVGLEYGWQDCDPPVWSDQVQCLEDYYDIRVELLRSEYTGGCLLRVTVNEETFDPVEVTVCTEISLTVTMYDGTEIDISCKGCDCEVDACSNPCCPGSTLVESTFTLTSVGHGALGCPEYETSPIMPTPFTLEVCEPPGEIVAAFPHEICDAFCTNVYHSVPGSNGNFSYLAVLLCYGSGAQKTAFIKYNEGAELLGLPSNTWIETAGGFECPDCGPGDTGEIKPVTLWYDVFVNCGVCNSLILDGDGHCVPNTIFSVRYYFETTGTCL